MPDCVLSQTYRHLLDLTWDWPPEGDDAVPCLSCAPERSFYNGALDQILSQGRSVAMLFSWWTCSRLLVREQACGSEATDHMVPIGQPSLTPQGTLPARTAAVRLPSLKWSSPHFSPTQGSWRPPYLNKRLVLGALKFLFCFLVCLILVFIFQFLSWLSVCIEFAATV